MKCVQIHGDDAIPGLLVQHHQEQRRPFVLIGTLYSFERNSSPPWKEGYGDKAWLSDELVERLCSTGASRLFNCDVRRHNDTVSLYPETPETADYRLVVASYKARMKTSVCVVNGGGVVHRRCDSTETRTGYGQLQVSVMASLHRGAELVLGTSSQEPIEGTGSLFRRADTREVVTPVVTIRFNHPAGLGLTID